MGNHFLTAIKASSALLVVVFVAMAVMPGVLGASDYVVNPAGVVVNLQPQDTAAVAGTTVNIANATSPTQLEPTALAPIMQQPGRYYGPYTHSSLFRFSFQSGGNFSFQLTLHFTRQQILNGVSQYVVRWPVDPLDFSSLCFDQWGLASDMPFPTAPITADHMTTLYGFRQNLVAPSTLVRIRQLCVTNDKQPELTAQPTLGSFDYFDTSGYYYTDFLGLIPDVDYHFVFVGTLLVQHTPAVWVSIEKYQVETETVFNWVNSLTGAVSIQTLPMYPAIAFDFLQGAGEGGLTSYAIPFNGDTANFLTFRGSWGGPGKTSPVSGCADHLSFYLPYVQQTTVTFRVWVTFFVGGSEPVGEPSLTEIVPAITVTGRNFLLMSTPDTIGQISGISSDPVCAGTAVQNIYFIFISASAPITVLAYVPATWGTTAPADGGGLDQTWGVTMYNQSANLAGIPRCHNIFYVGTVPDTTKVGYNETDCFPFTPPPDIAGYTPPGGPADISWIRAIVPPQPMDSALFIVIAFTSGKWATVTPGPYYQTYNFGWGSAYLFPGEVDLTMFLNNGTAVGFDQIAGFVPGADCGIPVANAPAQYNHPFGWSSWVSPFLCFVENQAVHGGGLAGTLGSIFDQIFQDLKALGTWIYNFLVSVYQAIAQAVGAFLEVVRVVTISLLTAMPLVVALFVGSRGLGDWSDVASEANLTVSRFRSAARRGWERGRRLPGLHARSRIRRRREQP